MFRRKSLISVAALGVLAVTLAGCSTPAAEPTEGAASDTKIAHPEVHDLLPDDIIERGYITNMMQIPNAPLEFEDESGELAGIDPTLIDAVSDVLGVEIRTESTADFAALLPSLDSGRTDIVFSAILSTEERLEAGYSFVDYFQSYTTFMFRSDDADDISSFGDLCGRTVTGTKGTQYPELAAQVSDEYCVAKGLDPITVLTLDATPQQVTQLQQKRSDAAIMGVEYEAYEMSKAPGEFEVMDEQLDPARYGIVALGANEQILVAIQAALEVLAEDGRYQDALAEWSLEGSALDEFELKSAK